MGPAMDNCDTVLAGLEPLKGGCPWSLSESRMHRLSGGSFGGFWGLWTASMNWLQASPSSLSKELSGSDSGWSVAGLGPLGGS